MTRVLIVDDNEIYRSAFRRNLLLRDFDVIEADNADAALTVYEEQKPDIVVTDLSMRTPTEGLDLIRTLKRLDPLMPVVMISAVGTFEEGSLAKELGADRVLSKQKIDEQIDELYRAIETAKEDGTRFRAIHADIERIARYPEEATQGERDFLQRAINAPRQHPVIVAEAYDALMSITQQEVRRQLESEFQEAGTNALRNVETELSQHFDLSKFDPETDKQLRTAEYFFQQQGGDTPLSQTDFSRNIGFSYCFAVENEAKARLKKRLGRFLSDKSNMKLVMSLYDSRRKQLDLHYHQHLLRLQQSYNFDFTMDNVRQVFERILEHEGRYKPDGLKALGIMIVCFGRDYTVRLAKGSLRINNPLGLKGFAEDLQTLRFALLLVSLQHYRNPYIHPEISEMEKISKIRATSIECLKDIAKLN